MDPQQVATTEETRSVSPPTSNNGVKRERSDDEEDARRVAQRTSTGSIWGETANIKVNVKGMVRLNDTKILTQIMEKLRTILLRQSLQDYQEFHRVGGCLAVVTAMEKHPDCERLQGYGVAVLGNAAWQIELKSAVAGVDGIQAINAAMKRFPVSKDMQTYGIKALFNLSNHAPSAEIMVVNTDGIRCVINGMKAFQDSIEIMRYGCNVFLTLCTMFENLKKPMRDAKVATVLAGVMDDDKVDENIQDLARVALKSLL